VAEVEPLDVLDVPEPPLVAQAGGWPVRATVET
jgi:hypothetical protein